MSLKNLTCLSDSELNSFLDSFDDVLCDCDGVLYNADNIIPGVKETITKLREYKKNIYYVSNNNMIGFERLHTRINNFGFGAKEEEIAIPILAVTAYLKKIKYDKEIFVIGSSAVKKAFTTEGFVVADDGPDKIEESYADLVKHTQDDNTDIGAVVVDLDLNLNYYKLLKALVYLQRPEVLFITSVTDKSFTLGMNTVLIGPKYFQDALEDLSNKTPIHFGKPAPNLMKYISDRFCIQNPTRTLFVGDSLEQDMEFATNGGFQKLLVLTGITSLDQVKKCTDKNKIPDFYISSFGDLHKIITK